MNIFIMVFMIINLFTYAAYSMEITDLSEHKINPIDAELLKRIVKEEVSTSNIDIIQKIKDIINNQVKSMKMYTEALNDKNTGLEDKVIFISNHFGDKSCLNAFRQYGSSSKFKQTFNNSLINYSNALEAEITALHILDNSFSYNLSREQLILLLPEVLRLYTTNGVNYNNTNGQIWSDNMSNVVDILALLLVMIEMTDESNEQEKILVFCHDNIGKRNWFWKAFIDLMDIKDQESPLWLSPEDKAFFHYEKVMFMEVPPELNLKQTKLFTILDIKAREQLGQNSHYLLSKYSIFDGDIYKYMEKQRQDALKILLTEKKSNYKKNYPSKKAPKNDCSYKKDNKKVGKSYPAKNSKNNIVINHNIITSYNIAPATINNKIINDEDDDFITVKQPKIPSAKNYDEKDDLIKKYIDNNKLRDQLDVYSYDNLVSLAKKRKLHQYEYYSHENIIRINQINGYYYDNKYFEMKNHFNLINKKIRDAGLMKPKYLVKYDNKEATSDYRKTTQQNLFAYFITFHFSDNDENFTETYYGEVYSTSRAKSDSWITARDMLSEEEKNNYDQSCNSFKHLYLSNFIADHCKKSIDGCWLRNAKHTEPTFVIDLSERKLAKFIKDIYAKHNNSINSIDAVIIGITSEYDICGRCQSLLQGLQWNLSHILQTSLKQIKRRDMTELIKINPYLITMIIANTVKDIENKSILTKETKKISYDEPDLDDGENHRLFLYKNNL